MALAREEFITLGHRGNIAGTNAELSSNFSESSELLRRKDTFATVILVTVTRSKSCEGVGGEEGGGRGEGCHSFRIFPK